MIIDWKKYFVDSNSKGHFILSFNEPAKEHDLGLVAHETGVEITGDLLALLKQTNGIRDMTYGDYIILSTGRIIERYKLHLEFIKNLDETLRQTCLFFAYNGCGEDFGFIVNEGKIVSGEVVQYYPIENEFVIDAPDFRTWVDKWFF